MGRLLRICVFLLSVSFVSAQKEATDSLLLQLSNHPKNDTSKVNLLNKIALSLISSDSAKAMEFADKAEALSNELKYHKGKAYSYFVRAKNLSQKRADTSAIAQFLKAVQIAELGGENYDAANYLGHLGAFYINTGDTEDAKECYEKGIKLCIATNNKRKLSQLLVGLGIVYSEHGEFLKALDCNDQALKISSSLNDLEVQSSALNNTGSIFYDLGNYPKAQDYYFQSLKIKEKIGDKKRLINSYLNIGSIIWLQGNNEPALEYMNKALAIAVEIKDKRFIGQCYEEIGKLQQRSNKQAALANFEKALSYANELTLSKSVISNLINIGDVNIEMSRYDEAWSNYSKALTLANSIGRKQDMGRLWRKIGLMHYHKMSSTMQLPTHLRV